MQTEAVGNYAFLCVFQVLGGAIVGAALRGMIRGQWRGITRLLGGLLFGGIPLVMGWGIFASGGLLWFGVQCAVFAGAMLVTLLTPDSLRQMLGDQRIGAILIGGIFMIVGLVIGALTWQAGPLRALALGGLFGGVGLFALFAALWSLLKTQ